MKRKMAVIVSVALLISCMLSGCGLLNDSYDDIATNKGYEEKLSEEEIGENPIPEAEMKVGVLYISDPEEGSGYSYTHDLGIKGMQANLGLEPEQIVRKIVADTDKQATKKAIQECVDAGCKIVFTTSWGYMDATEEMAEKYPEVYFSHGTGYKSNGKNFNNYFGRIYQARYLSGLVAGLNTKSNKIGYVAAMGSDNSEVTGGIDAFAIGVEDVNPDAKIYVKVTNSWYDAEKEKAAAEALLDMGCDVMTQHCDTPYPQTLAEERGVYGIGYNSDMSIETPDSCLCSVIWNWSAYYTAAVKSVLNGTWDGSNYYGGMVDQLVQITKLASFCSERTEEKVDEMRERILNGTFQVFEGLMNTNTGSQVGNKSGVLDDETITGGINWYYQNVVVVK